MPAGGRGAARYISYLCIHRLSSPIGEMLAKVKALLTRAGAQTCDTLAEAIDCALEAATRGAHGVFDHSATVK